VATNVVPIVDHLKTIRSNFCLGLFAYCYLRRLRPEQAASADRVIVSEDGIYCVPQRKPIPQSAGDAYEMSFVGPSGWNLEHAASEFAKMLVRNFTGDSYETLFSYCDRTGQLADMQAQT